MSRSVYGLLWLSVAFVLSGCGGGGTKAMGTEGGACYGSGTCNAGLQCLSGLCVSLGDAGLGDAGLGDAGLGDAGLGDAGPFDGSAAPTDGGVDAAAVLAGHCDPLEQVGCNPGQACIWSALVLDGGVPGAFSGTCVPAGSQQPGSPCSVDRPCVPGSVCFGQCVAYCDTRDDDPYCLRSTQTGHIGLQLPACDAFLQNCEGGWACIVDGPVSSCFPPVDPSAVADGDACGLGVCGAGLQCVREGSGGTAQRVCRPFCDASSPTACDGAEVGTCKPVESLIGMSSSHLPSNLGICTTATSLDGSSLP